MIASLTVGIGETVSVDGGLNAGSAGNAVFRNAAEQLGHRAFPHGREPEGQARRKSYLGQSSAALSSRRNQQWTVPRPVVPKIPRSRL